MCEDAVSRGFLLGGMTNQQVGAGILTVCHGKITPTVRRINKFIYRQCATYKQHDGWKYAFAIARYSACSCGHADMRTTAARVIAHIGIEGGDAGDPRIRCADPHRLRALARPRLLATKSPPGSSLNARTLRGVRFSARMNADADDGSECHRPHRNGWWRRGESNSGPRKPPDRHLQAQSLI